jgi:hypothetical protein
MKVYSRAAVASIAADHLSAAVAAGWDTEIWIAQPQVSNRFVWHFLRPGIRFQFPEGLRRQSAMFQVSTPHGLASKPSILFLTAETFAEATLHASLWSSQCHQAARQRVQGCGSQPGALNDPVVASGVWCRACRSHRGSFGVAFPWQQRELATPAGACHVLAVTDAVNLLPIRR